MFEDYQGLINLEEILYKEYNYTFKGDYQDLYKQPFIEMEGNGVYARFWINYRGTKYLYKLVENPEVNIWGELLSEKVADFLGIESARYRVCKFDNSIGLITKSFVKDNETLILGSEIFQRFIDTYPYAKDSDLLNDPQFVELYQVPDSFANLNAKDQKKYLFKHFNNLEHIWAILSLNKNIKPDDLSSIIIALRNKMIFDIITIQCDSHQNNWAIKTDGVKSSLAPLYDNSTSFGLGYFNMERRMHNFYDLWYRSRFLEDNKELNAYLYEARPSLSVSSDNTTNYETLYKETPPKMLKYFLEINDENTNFYISKLIASLSEEVLERIIEDIERINGITISANVYAYILNIFGLHMENLKGILKQHWRNIQHEPTK